MILKGMAFPVLKPIFIMANFKIISVTFSVMALSFFVSCDTEEVKKTDNDGSLELNDSGAISVQKRSGGEKVYRTVSYNESNKEEVLSELIEGFIEYLYIDLAFDSQEEVVTFDVEKHIKEQQYVLKYEVSDIGYIACGFVFMGVDFEILNDKEKMGLQCNGGTEDGEYIISDRLTGKISEAKQAKKLLTFINDCLNGGGCVEVCTASVEIAAIVSKTSDPRITE